MSGKGKRSRTKNRESSAPTSARRRTRKAVPRAKRGGTKFTAPRPRALNPRQLAAKDHALEALGKMRREGWGERRATKWAHIDSRTFRKYVGSALLKPARPGGKVRAAKGDKITRNLLFAGADGTLNYRSIRGSKAASELSQYFKDLRAALRDRKLTEFEARWKGMKVGGNEVLADAAKIQELAEAGLLKFESLYKQARGGRR